MSADHAHGNELTSTGFSLTGPKKDGHPGDFTIAGGPALPGSYPETPQRITVRLTDPHIEAQEVPGQVTRCHNARPGKDDILGAERGTSRQ